MKTVKKILVIGGGTYQVPVIKRIIELGHRALCVDKNPDAPGLRLATASRAIDALDKEACLRYAKENEIDAVLTYGATLPLPTVAYVGKALNLPTLPLETAEISTSKYEIKKRLAERGCNIRGDFFEMDSMESARKQTFSFPCVVKPSDGSGSKGVAFARNASELDAALKEAFAGARYGKIYKEDLIDGEEYTVEAFVCYGKAHIYAVVKTTFEKKADGEIVYGHRTPAGLPRETEAAISAEVVKAIDALQITMASVNFDVVLADDGKPYIIDCGIRIGQNLIASHLVPYARGVSVIDNTIRLALGEKIDPEPKTNRCVATRLLIYRPGKIVEIRDTKELIGVDGVVDVVLRKKVGDEQREYRDKSDTCGWVIAEGDVPEEAERRAEKAKRLLEKYIVIVPNAEKESKNEI